MKRLFFAFAMLLAALSASAQHADNHQHTHQHSHLPEGVGEAPAVVETRLRFAPRVGLAVQKSAMLEIGASLDRYRIGYTPASEYKSFTYSNLRPYVAGEIGLGRRLGRGLAGGKTGGSTGGSNASGSREFFGGGKVGVEYILASPIFGMAAGADVSYLTDGQRVAALVTPRLMLSLVYVEVFYGYSFFVRNGLANRVGHHRFGISTTLDTHFWRRKRAMYGDYYDSYLE